MGRSDEEIRRKAEEFVVNAEKGDNAANDRLVEDMDPRKRRTVDGTVTRRR